MQPQLTGWRGSAEGIGIVAELRALRINKGEAGKYRAKQGERGQQRAESSTEGRPDSPV